MKWFPRRDRKARKMADFAGEVCDERLSQIATNWPVVDQARAGQDGEPPSGEAHSARHWLIERYRGPALNYLRGATGDDDTAQDLCHDFVWKILSGGFQKADPGKGKFRDYVRTTLQHMVTDHQRRAARLRPLDDHEAAGLDCPATILADRFKDDCRKDLLEATWQRLRQEGEDTGHPYLTALRLRVTYHGESSEQLAVRLGDMTGKTYDTQKFRRLVHKAYLRAANHLVDVVARTLFDPSLDDIVEELNDLRLYDFKRIREVIEDRRQATAR